MGGVGGCGIWGPGFRIFVWGLGFGCKEGLRVALTTTQSSVVNASPRMQSQGLFQIVEMSGRPLEEVQGLGSRV
jgi:hypothetical protein